MTRYGEIPRRGFLGRVSAAASSLVSLPYFVPASALGRSGTTAPSNRLTLALIGCGGMGRSNLRAFLNFPDVQVVALCDLDREHLQSTQMQVNEGYGNSDCRTYGDFRELLDKERLDVVTHAVPDHWHALVSVACLKRGMDVYGEKPLARTVREGRSICDAVARYGRIWQTGSWQRSVANFHRGCELVRNGRIGKIHSVEVGLPDGSGPRYALPRPVPEGLNWDMWLGPAPWRPFMDFGKNAPHWDWRWILDYSGGQMTDWAGHHIDIALWGLGLEDTGPISVEGRGKYHSAGVWDVPYEYSFECLFEGGIRLRVANASALPKGMGAVWYGDRGWIHVDRGDVLRASDPGILKEKIGREEIRLYRSTDHQRNFIDCVKQRRETITPARIAQRSISVGLLGEIAMLTQRKLAWDPVKEEFPGDLQANRYLARPFRGGWHL